jgi:hypothetical protein
LLFQGLGSSKFKNDKVFRELDQRRHRRFQHLDPIEDSGTVRDPREANAVRRYFTSSAERIRRRWRRNGGAQGERRHSWDGRPLPLFGRGDLGGRRRLSSVGDLDDIGNGDKVVLVQERPKSSPVLVRILRAVTPRAGAFSAGSGRNRRPGYGRQNSRSRVFQLVRESFERVRKNSLYLRELGKSKILDLRFLCTFQTMFPKFNDLSALKKTICELTIPYLTYKSH